LSCLARARQGRAGSIGSCLQQTKRHRPGAGFPGHGAMGHRGHDGQL